MYLENAIQEISNKTSSIDDVKNWLNTYSELSLTYQKFEKCSVKILPCFCPIRNSECLLLDIQLYLKSQIEVYNQNLIFEAKILDYQEIAYDQERMRKWLSDNLEFGLNNLWFFMSPNYPNIKKSFINGKIKDKFKYIKIEIDGKDFKHIYDFANLFSKLFFEEKILLKEYTKWKKDNEIID